MFLLAGAYFVAGKLGLELASVHPSATAVWAPTGITLAALLLGGIRLWPGAFLGAFLVNATTYGTVATSLGIAAGNTLEGVVGALLLQRFAGGRRALETPGGVFRLAVLGAVLSTAVSATVGVTTLSLAGYAEWADYSAIWSTWWLGDAGGDLIAAPLILAWAAPRAARWTARRAAEACGVFAALLAASLGVLAGWPLDPAAGGFYGFVCIPPLVWLALRFGSRETATGNVLVAGCAVWGTVRGAGSFASMDAGDALVLLVAFVGIVACTKLAVAAVASERRAAMEALRTANDRLEDRVRERTARLNEAQEIAHLGFWSWDLPTDRVEWSPELHRIFDRSPEEFGATGAAFLECVHPEDRRHVSAVIREARSDLKPFEFYHRIVRQDGDVRTIHGAGKIVVDAAGAPPPGLRHGAGRLGPDAGGRGPARQRGAVAAPLRAVVRGGLQGWAGDPCRALAHGGPP